MTNYSSPTQTPDFENQVLKYGIASSSKLSLGQQMMRKGPNLYLCQDESEGNS